MKFTATIAKLTGFYVLIVMLISVGFSVAIYQISSNEIDRGLNRQDLIIKNTPRWIGMQSMYNFSDLRSQQLDDSNARLKHNLAYFNLFILMLSAFASYFLARWTLRPLKEAADEQNRFTADASHELKTPLAALRTEIEVTFRDKNFSASSAKKILTSNLEEIGKLETLSSALLKLAKLDETTKVDFTTLNLDEVIVAAYEKVESLAKKKNIEFEAKLKNAKIFGDQTMLTELFVMLLDNAIKYSPKNSKIILKMSSENKHHLVKIKDFGIGIKSSDLPRIFDRFYRADQSRTKNQLASETDGYGLGLSIAKQIVDLHSGEITASSTAGNGSEFSIKLLK